MKFNILFHKTALISAIENQNIDIVKLLLANKKINVNFPYILNKNLIKFKVIYFNTITF